MRYRWIVRVLANPLIKDDAVMLPFAREMLGRAQAEARPNERVDLILDQSRASERHQILPQTSVLRMSLWSRCASMVASLGALS